MVVHLPFLCGRVLYRNRFKPKIARRIAPHATQVYFVTALVNNVLHQCYVRVWSRQTEANLFEEAPVNGLDPCGFPNNSDFLLMLPQFGLYSKSFLYQGPDESLKWHVFIKYMEEPIRQGVRTVVDRDYSKYIVDRFIEESVWNAISEADSAMIVGLVGPH